MVGKKTQTTIWGAGYRAEVQLTVDQIKRWCIANFDKAASSLLHEWSEKIIGLAGLSLSSVEHAEFLLQGYFFEGDEQHKAPANKFWMLPPRTSLVFKDFDSSVFEFNKGLVSSYSNHEAVNYQFLDKDRAPISEEGLLEAGVTGLIRAYVAPCAANWANLQVVFYPRTEAELRAGYLLCNDVRFPGVRVFKSSSC